MEIKLVVVDPPEDCNVIIGQAHFIKTAEDIFETLVASVPNIKFGFAFCEASGPRLVRHDGTDEELRKVASAKALEIGAGHIFIIYLKGAYPINVLNAIKNVSEVCNIYCATANHVQVILGESGEGRGVLGVIDGYTAKGIEGEKEIVERKSFLRKIGYKLGN